MIVKRGLSKLARRLRKKMNKEQYRKDRINYRKGQATKPNTLGDGSAIPWRDNGKV